MSQGSDVLENRLRNLIDVHRDAHDLTNAEAIGVLEMMKLEIFNDILADEDEG